MAGTGTVGASSATDSMDHSVDGSLRRARTRLHDEYGSTQAVPLEAPGLRFVVKRDVLPHLPVSRDAIVADLGCGQGWLVRELLSCGYVRALGIDSSEEQVNRAHADGLHQVRLGDVFEVLNAPGAAFDALVATDLLEHFDKGALLRLLDGAHRALRPGGVFVARTPNAASPFAGALRYGDFTHESCLTPRSAAQVLRAVGFTTIRILPCEPAVHGLVSAARLISWRAAAAGMKLVSAAETGILHGHIVTRNMVVVASRSGARNEDPA